MYIEQLGYLDINSIADLQPEGWTDIIPAVSFYVDANFCFPVKAMFENKIVGIGTAIIHNNVAWLAHIIVQPDYRNQGIAKLITKTLIEQLKSINLDTIYLIATDLGEPVYRNLGFEVETEYLFFKDLKTARDFRISENIVPYLDQFKEQISALDEKVSSEKRMFHLEKYLRDGFVYKRGGQIEGFYLPGFGEGLIIAKTEIAGIELMKLRLSTKETAAFPVDNYAATQFMHFNNFKEFKTAKRMSLGKKRYWQPINIYNRIGGNLG